MKTSCKHRTTFSHAPTHAWKLVTTTLAGFPSWSASGRSLVHSGPRRRRIGGSSRNAWAYRMLKLSAVTTPEEMINIVRWPRGSSRSSARQAARKCPIVLNKSAFATCQKLGHQNPCCTLTQKRICRDSFTIPDSGSALTL